ncbi:monocarboxylate transporter 5-like [Mercenaria mercenaria]|uniref:monocarboxylate transporter 5-like n=1 Tax=Mercenaria mercenaria TaxID=6596 RepID=UPI00234FAFD7|nr:monocarboxylate transporter 5-like [Mercenaria mercenaria]
MTQAKFFDNDEKEDYYEEEEVRPPRRPGEAPDGGWGWMVAIGAFICSMFVEGLLFSYDEVVPYLSEYFLVQEESLISVGVLMKAFCLIGGPVIGVLVKRFSCRKVVMVGSVVTCILILVSTQMPGPATMRLTHGVLAGIGLGMVYQPSIMIIAFWFEHKRAFATGLALMGAGVGVFIFKPLYKHLLDIHDWKNATVILAALFLNCAAAGALFRPLTHAKPKGMKRGPIQRGAIMKALIAEKERQRTISNGSLDNCIITKDNRLIKIDKIDLRNKSNSYINRLKETFGFSSRSLNRSKNSLVVPKVVVSDPIYRPKSPRSSNSSNIVPKPSSTPPTPKRDSGCGSLEASPKLVTRSYEALPSDDPWDRNLVVNLPPKENTCSSDKTLNSLDRSKFSPKRQRDEKLDPSFLSTTASPVGSVRSMNSRSPSVVSQTSKNTDIYIPMKGSVMTVPTTVHSVHSLEMSTIMEEEELTDCRICRKLCRVLDLKLLKLQSFWLLILASFLTMIACAIPLVHLPKKAKSLGISTEKSSFLISILWVANMIGRFAFGWVADRPWASAVQLNNTMIVLAGFLSLFGQLFNSNSWLGFYAAFFGLFTAAFFTLRSIMLIELYGKDRLISSFGLLTFFQGFAVLLGYELSEILQGNVAFYIVGILLVSGGLLGIPLPRVKRWEENRENKLKIVHIEELTQHEQETLKIENCESTI